MKLFGIQFIVALGIHLLGLTVLFGTVEIFPKFSWGMLSIYLAIIIPLSYLFFFYLTARFRTIVSLVQIPIAGFASFATCGISYGWYEEYVETLDKSLEILITSVIAIALICLVKITLDIVTILLGFKTRKMKIERFRR